MKLYGEINPYRNWPILAGATLPFLRFRSGAENESGSAPEKTERKNGCVARPLDSV